MNQKFPEDNSFGEWLRQRRRLLDLTQQELAEQVGCARITLRRIEADALKPSKELALILLEKLGIPEPDRSDWILFARGNRPAPPASKEESDLPNPQIHLATFLFTDVEDSAKLWDFAPDKMKVALQRHHVILQEAISSNGGTVFQIVGDAFCAVFPTAPTAISAAVMAQRKLYQEPWDLPFPIRVRMGIHTGEAEPTSTGSPIGGYASNQTLNRVARIFSAGHGGQILLSLVTKELVSDSLPENTELRDMGEHHLKNLTRPEHIFQLSIAGLQSDFPSLNTLGLAHQNLPVQLTSFIGRENEQAEIKKLIATGRLVTLTGVGGIGKTRLSIQVASALLNDFFQGIWLVELAPLSDSALVTQVILTTLGLTEQSGRSPMRILIDFLQGKRALLILDNCEHLITACAQLSNDLLKQCPNLKIVATSREPLNITGEAVWQVHTLSVPDRERLSPTNLPLSFESVRLFVERAKMIKSDFALTDQNEMAVAQICQHLDGIPLAIELAAARVRMMTAEEIVSHLENRFDLLKQSQRTAMHHHQTLHATIDWSFDLLAEDERVLFRRLSVFAGGCTLETAEAICAGRDLGKDDIFYTLSHLVDKSLVNVETRNGSSRFQMLETIREYAREKLFESGESEILYSSHLSFFAGWMEQVDPKLHGPDQIHWLSRIETEYDNLRVALQWAAKNDVEMGLRLAGALGWFWFARGYPSEGIEQLNALIADDIPQTEPQVTALSFKAQLSSLTGDFKTVFNLIEAVLKNEDIGSPRQIAWTLRGKAIMLAWSGGDTQLAISLAEQAIATFQALGEQWHYGMSLFALGDVYLHAVKDYAMAERVHEKSLEVLRGIGDKFGIAHVLLSLGFNYLRQRNYARALELETEALVLLRELGDKSGIGWTLANLYNLARLQGDYEGARLLAEERLTLWRNVGFDLQVAWAIYDLGRIATLQNNPSIAASHFKESLLFFQQKGSLKERILCLIGPAHLFLAQGKLEHATRLYAAFQNLSESNHIELEPGAREEIQGILKMLRVESEEIRFAEAWVAGKNMSLDEALDLALKTLAEV
jgi:predicted ATPase/class 3 adenylate cyclase/DNA-binding XRE family transcriptional regulator